MDHTDGRHSLTADGTRLAEALAAQVDQLAVEVAEYLSSRIPSYQMVEESVLVPAIQQDLASIVRTLVSGRSPDGPEVQEMAAPADQRARQGVPIEAVLATYRVGGQFIWAWIDARSSEFDVGADDLLSISRSLSQWFDAVTAEVALVHRRAEVELARRDARSRAEFLHGLVFGSLAPAELQVRAATYDLKSAHLYRAFRARAWDEHSRRRLESRLLTVGAARGCTPFVGMLDTDLVGVLPNPPDLPEDLDVLCALGPPHELAAADSSFRTASRVLEAAVGFQLRGVVTLADLGPRMAVASEKELGDDLIARFVTPLDDMGGFGCELMTTLREYLHQGLRVEATAEALFVHANTVRHRLHRFEEVTGADTRSFDDLIHVWWALERSNLDEGPGAIG